jgi:uncharacterized protein with PIN domain
MVDHMLVGLGKYLRILGYDTAWDTRERTHELIRRANEEGRIFLTANAHLPEQFPPADRVLILKPHEPLGLLREVIDCLRLDVRRWLFSRCIRCNVALEAIADPRKIEDRVHPEVYRRHKHFYRCPTCGTVFWHGSHVRNTCRKLGIALPREAA